MRNEKLPSQPWLPCPRSVVLEAKDLGSWLIACGPRAKGQGPLSTLESPRSFTEHLRHPCGLFLVCCAGAHPSVPTVDQPILPALLKNVRKPPEWRSLKPRSSPASTKLKRPARCKLIASRTRAILTSGNMRFADPKTGQTTCYLNRTCHVLATKGRARPIP